MRIRLDELTPFKEICRKICLNIPPTYCWHWDAKRKMAVVVLDGEDAELVFYPLFKEFSHHWNFSSSAEKSPPITEKVTDIYGLLPGQVFFTSNVLHNLVLCVAWWPWGNEGKCSMRVGLVPINTVRLKGDFSFQCLKRWLPIMAETTPSAAAAGNADPE